MINILLLTELVRAAINSTVILVQGQQNRHILLRQPTSTCTKFENGNIFIHA